jgi:beta-lactamase superfamily II metal-dependent hydrolase
VKLTVFQSDKGDCLLLTASDGTRLLADGGMRDSYAEHVAPALGALRQQDLALDLVYLSHVDQDHIAGILQLMDDEVAWRVHDFQLGTGNTTHREPHAPRPPKVAQIWHNAFHDQVGANAGAIDDMLAATAVVLEAVDQGGDRELARAQRDLTAGIADAIKLTRRVGPEQLGIPVNQPFDGRLALVRDGDAAIRLGSVSITLIGPFEQELADLRRDWNKWLRENQQTLERIRASMRQDAQRLGTSEFDRLRANISLKAGELGDRSKVTTPNLASLMLLAEENGASVLLTGDGHRDDILKGLEHAGRLDQQGAAHFNVLKVQHHGSEHNLDQDFCRRVSADNYVICANGNDENPDLRVVEAIIDSRIGSSRQRTRNDQASAPFKLWFNSSSTATPQEKNREHMKAVERLVTQRAGGSEGRMTFTFLNDHSFDLPVR